MKILIISSFPAPYRVDVFKEISKVHDTTIFFETGEDQNRNAGWFSDSSELHFEILNKKETIDKYNKLIKNIEKFDVVLAYDFYVKSAMKAQMMCILKKIPYFVNCDGAFIRNSKIKGMIKRFFIKHSAGCFASGTYAKEYFLHFGANKEKIYTHNFTSLKEDDILKDVVSDEEKKKLKMKLRLNENKKTVLSIGQFIERKGFDTLLNAWENITEEYELVLIGGGILEESYRSIIEKRNIKNVYIKGFKDKNEIKDYYKASDLFVLPTREDIWGLVINEAMAYGLPVITTDRCIAGLELIEVGKNGFIFSVDNINELYKYMKLILENDDISMEISLNNIKKMQGNTVENIGKQHLNDISKCLKI